MRRLVAVLGHPWFGGARDAAFVAVVTVVVFTVSDGYPGWEAFALAGINTLIVYVWMLAADVYDISHPRVAAPPIGRLFRGLVWVLLTYLAVHFVTEGEPERRTIIFAFSAAAGAIALGYFVRAFALMWFQRRGALRERLLIVGGDAQAQTVATQIAREHRLALTLVGALDEFSPRSSRLGPVEVLGDPLDLEAVVDRMRATAVVVVANAISWEAQEHVMQVAADRPGLRVFMVAGVSDLLSSEVLPARDGLPPLVRLRRAQLPFRDAFIKRGMDIVLAGAMLPALAPTLLLARLSGGSPVTRTVDVLGRGGRTVRMRLIAPGAPGTLRAHLANGRAGKLPALPAVISGHLSIVGPRPLPIDSLAATSSDPWRRRLLLMRPGLTGPWEVGASTDDGLVDDLTYIRTYTLWADVRLIFASLRRAVRRQTAVPVMREASASWGVETRPAREPGGHP